MSRSSEAASLAVARTTVGDTAADPVSPASGGRHLPPMAPRVVVRQPQATAPVIEAVSGTPAIQRAWSAARPTAATSEPASSASSVLAGHHRRTTDHVEASPPRSATPTQSASGGVHTATRGEPAGVDVDRLIEALEERVLAEIERRGGRYTGLF